MEIDVKHINTNFGVGDILITIRENGHETPYMIALDDDCYVLVNLNSGYINYAVSKDRPINDLIELYVLQNLDSKISNSTKLNPIIAYYFVHSYDVRLFSDMSFGQRDVNGGNVDNSGGLNKLKIELEDIFGVELDN